MAEAVHTIALEIYQESPDHGNIFPSTLSGLASQYVNALNLLGRSEEVIEFTKEFIPFYEHIGENENLPALKTARINALLNLKQIDKAEQELKDPKLRGNFATDIEVRRLEGILAQIKRDMFGLKNGVESGQSPGAPDGEYLIGMLKQALGTAFKGHPQKEELLEAADRLDPSNRLNPNTKAGFSKLAELLNQGERFLTGIGAEDNEWTVKGKIRNASSIFVYRKPSRDEIEQSLTTLEQCLDWAMRNSDAELQNDALWGIYLCYSRSDRPSQAADALLHLKKNLEDLRKGIKDPRKRGGMFARYPHLFDALCEKLQMAERAGDLLESIEASKGRGVADILTRKGGNVVADASIYSAVKDLPKMTSTYGFHYLTYYVDEERTYAVLVSKSGNIHLTEPTSINKSAIRDGALNVDPRMWGEPSEEDPSIIIEDVRASLASLIKCLETLMDQGVLQAGDHLCYSADDNFHNVPLHYLMFKGKPLIDTFSVSRIHNALHLQHLLERPTTAPPEEFVSLTVPTLQNIQNNNWPQIKHNLWRPAKWLEKNLSGKNLENEQCTKAQIRCLDLTNKIVQFSTHGYFPQEKETQNPFKNAGLVISNGEGLPDEREIVRENLDTLLTPNKVLELGLKLDNSHVSLMACVSGLSREGIGGDALGMEWAFVQAGAASLLSSHWIVSVELAADFFERFYDHWILQKKSRARAYCNTIQDLRDQGGKWAYPYCWAAFSLAGEWR
ncbi:MAG: CHAT domain-containing protein [bacterium]